CRPAAKGLELRIDDDVVLDLQKDLHDIAADRVPYFADAVRVLDLPHIARVFEVIHHGFAIHCILRPLLLSGTGETYPAGGIPLSAVPQARYRHPHRCWHRRASAAASRARSPRGGR